MRSADNLQPSQYSHHLVSLPANRDEFHARKALPLAWRSLSTGVTSGDQQDSTNAATVLAGLDCAAGGTWLGISKTGRLALLTNISEAVLSPTLESGQPRPSRGALVADFLIDQHPSAHQGSTDPLTFTKEHQEQLPDYAGFNLLIATLSAADPTSSEFALLTNRSSQGSSDTSSFLTLAGTWTGSEVKSGAVSNGPFLPGVQHGSSSAWPKVKRGQSKFSELISAPRILQRSEDDLLEDLLDLMT